MDKFYPKNFVMWRPQVLLFLIFLEAIYDSTGLVKGADATYTGGAYKSFCTESSQCRREYECSSKQECICRNSFESERFKPGSKYVVIYNFSSQKCVAPVGKVCTLPVLRGGYDDNLHKIDCVPDAICDPQPGKRLPSNLGLCKCENKYQETEKHLCEHAMMIQNGDENAMLTMAHLVGPPTEEHMSESEKTAVVGNLPNKGTAAEAPASSIGPSITVDTRDKNADLDLENYKIPLEDNWTKTDLRNSAGNFLSGCKFTTLLTIVFFLLLFLS